MYIHTCVDGSTHLVSKRAGQKVPHFAIVGCSINKLDKRKIREYLNRCDWSYRACPAWYPANMRPDGFMKDTPTRRPRK